MLQTLFYIPRVAFGLPVFGFGILLFVWAFASGVFMTWLVRKQGWNADTKGYIPVLGLIGAAICFLLPALAEDKGLPIRGYGTMVLLGVASGIWLAARRAIRANLDPELILSLAFWMFLAGMLGARIFYIIEFWKQQFLKPTLGETLAAMANIAQGGLVVYGALFGGTLAFFIYALHKKLPVWGTFDLIAPSMVLGLALGRIGCFMNGCCFGGACSLPWAVQFPWNSPPQVRQATEVAIDLPGFRLDIPKGKDGKPDMRAKPLIGSVVPGSEAEKQGLKPGDVIQSIGTQANDGTITTEFRNVSTAGEVQEEFLRIFAPGAPIAPDTQVKITTEGNKSPISWKITLPLPGSNPVHPTQLYASIGAFVLFLFLLAWYPYRRHDGELMAWMLVIYGVIRFLEEKIRSDERGVFGTGLTISQHLSVLMLLAGVGLWVYLLFYQRPRPLNFYAAAGN